VEIKNAEVEPLLAPDFLRETAVGITAQEQRGKGTPIREAVKIDENFLPPSNFLIRDILTKEWSSPATTIPSRRNGEEITK
jgi:hypothetical protein